ncbi:MAG: SIS domain-containing protein, partial [Candidatus Omnitrophica bacterium]|nr:SIS domain-containing protein [Candidatus Omnitrophota bacterium]
MEKIFEQIVSEHKNLIKQFLDKAFQDKVLNTVSIILSAIKEGKKVLLCGNGGSAADCQHFAGEMIGRFLKERQSLPFISLTTNTSILTCIGNDYSFDNIFSRQIEGIGSQGDILISFSTSGSSKNIINAVYTAKNKKMKVIGFTGTLPNPVGDISDICIGVDSKSTPRIQEIHILLIHTICLFLPF